MPIRTASLNKQLHKNGVKLHQAIESRVHSEGAEHAASEHEKQLSEERRLLKEAKAKRAEQVAQPKPKAARFVHHEAKPKAPKAVKHKDDKEGKPKAKPAKDHLSATDKRAKKAEALQAAKNAAKKSAKT